MIRVGLFVDTYFPMIDGVIEVVHNYAVRLNADEEFEVTVFCPKHGKGYEDKFTYRVVRCKSRQLKIIDYSLPQPKRDKNFKKILEESNLDIVHIHSPFMVGKVGVKYAKKHNIPVVASMHSQFEQDFYRATHSKLITKFMIRYIMRVFNRCDECYAVSPAVADVFVRYGAKKRPGVLYTGTDMQPVADGQAAADRINAAYGITADLPVFVFVGRITKLKNVGLIVDALALLKDRRFKMFFVGDGQDLPDLKKRVKSDGLEDNIVFLGRIGDRQRIAELYSRAQLLLFPSMYDTNSLVQKEAAAQGTPTLFAEGAVTASEITDGVNGYIAMATPESYARKIEEILSDKENYAGVCETAKRELYRTWDAAVDELKEEYKKHIDRTMHVQ